MFLKKRNRFFHTVTFRLTVLYLILFAILLTAVFFLIDINIISYLKQRSDSKLIDMLTGWTWLEQVVQHKPENLLQEVDDGFEVERITREPNEFFYTLLSPEKRRIIASGNLDRWAGLDFSSENLPYLPLKKELPDQNNPSTLNTSRLEYVFPTKQLVDPKKVIVLETKSLPGRKHKARIGYMKTGNDMVMVIGVTLRDDELFIASYRRIFVIAFGIMLVSGSSLGFFISHKAMAGVKRVTQTALNVGKGDLTLRVQVGNEGQEISNLVDTFNSMLDRIHVLIVELKEVTNNIAHDLRSPLTRIRGVAEITLTSKADLKEYQDMAGSIIHECDRLIEMVNTLLDIAALDSGTLPISDEPMNITELLNIAYELFQPAAEDKKVQLELNNSAKPLIMQGNVTNIQRAIANIIDNAIKFTLPGGKVRISARDASGKVEIRITDTGCGIRPQDLPHIFKRFYRADHSRSTNGNGLGLSLAEAIICAHSGSISVNSSEMKGSEFIIILPLAL